MSLSPSGEYLVYVGSAFYPGQTGGQTEGAIYVYRFQSATGILTPLGLAAETNTPGFFAIHPSGQFLHTVNEIGNYQGKKSGAVSAFTIDKRTGRLQFLNAIPSGDPYPTYLTVAAKGAYVLVSNYFGGVAVFPVSNDGRLHDASSYIRETGSGSGVNRERQEAPHPHSVELSGDNRFAIAVDLGLDKLLVYRFDQTKGALTPNDPPFAVVNPGAGPRHIAFSPDARFLYSINELQSSISTFSYDATTGRMRPVQTISTLPRDFNDWNSGAEVRVSASGKFLYCSNRGHNSIAVFSIDAKDGELAPIEHVSTGGTTPRNFEIDPTGAYLFAANEDSDSILLLRMDKVTGRLTTGSKVKVTSPVCIKFLPLD
jgi:6-phosphogluconolactonase